MIIVFVNIHILVLFYDTVARIGITNTGISIVGRGGLFIRMSAVCSIDRYIYQDDGLSIND